MTSLQQCNETAAWHNGPDVLDGSISTINHQNADLNRGVTDILEGNDPMSISTSLKQCNETADRGGTGFRKADVINIRYDTLENVSEGDSVAEDGSISTFADLDRGEKTGNWQSANSSIQLM